MSDWVIHNFVTGQDQSLPRHDPNEPTPEWVEGWNAMMEFGASERNPYGEGITEHHEWQDGYEAAGKD